MKVLQLNTKKSFVAAIELARITRGKEDFICLITEPYRHKGKVASVPRGTKIVCPRVNPRAAIFYNGQHDLLEIESLMNQDCAVAVLKTPARNILIASCLLYTSPSPRDS